MAKIVPADLLKRFKKVGFETVQLETEGEKIAGLFSKLSLEPENHKPAEHDPNDIFVTISKEPKEPKKKKAAPNLKIGKAEPAVSPSPHKAEPSEEKQKLGEERQKVYRPGPFALFYELNEGELKKEDKVWYYKDAKEIHGPVSSYNMDKLIYFKTIDDETKVAFKTVEKFVKVKKIKSILEDEKANKQ